MQHQQGDVLPALSGLSLIHIYLVKDVTDSLEKYELGMAVQKLYDFIWYVFCDWYIAVSYTHLARWHIYRHFYMMRLRV